VSLALIALVCGAGIVVGILSALFGVGGGILMVPFIVLVLERSQHLAEGTSLLVIVPTAIVGALAHRKSDYVSFKHAALLAAGGMGGAYAGAALAVELSADTLQLAFGALMAYSGLRTIVAGSKQLRAERKKQAAGGKGGEPPENERRSRPDQVATETSPPPRNS
jgi:uncharacterized protein